MGKVNFGRLLHQAAKRYADREAIVNIERNRRFTFMELHRLSNKICNMFKDRFKMEKGDIYLTLLENDNMSLLHFWMFKGASSGGWLNYRDAFEEQIWQVELIKPKLVLMETELVDKYYDPLRKMGIEIIYMDPLPESREGTYYFWDLVEEASDEDLDIEHDADEDILLYRFTGGTTGKGKCATYTINNLMVPAYGFYSHPEDLIPQHIRHLQRIMSNSMPRDSFEKGSVYHKRQVDLAIQLFKLMDIPRDDIEKRLSWLERGFRFFNAPAAIILMSDKSLPAEYVPLDIGAVMYGICLVALEFDLGTCIEDQGKIFEEHLRNIAGIPESKEIHTTIAIGHPNWDFPANRVESAREDVDNITIWQGFPE